MKTLIQKLLKNLEMEKGVKILFAVESGSRAWRMSSEDSDFDIRFVFVRPTEEYLQINRPGEVISAAYDKEGKNTAQEGAFIDVVGFEIFKFARMLSSSNPSVIEWLQSDIIYYGSKPKTFVEYAQKSFKPISLYYHYKSMGKQNYLKYLKNGNSVTYKKYLYAMRGIVNSIWVAKYETLPPIDFTDTLDRINAGTKIVPDIIITRLKDIIELKKDGKEKDIVANETRLDTYIESCLKDDSGAPQVKQLTTLTELNKEILGLTLYKEFQPKHK